MRCLFILSLSKEDGDTYQSPLMSDKHKSGLFHEGGASFVCLFAFSPLKVEGSQRNQKLRSDWIKIHSEHAQVIS